MRHDMVIGQKHKDKLRLVTFRHFHLTRQNCSMHYVIGHIFVGFVVVGFIHWISHCLCCFHRNWVRAVFVGSVVAVIFEILDPPAF